LIEEFFAKLLVIDIGGNCNHAGMIIVVSHPETPLFRISNLRFPPAGGQVVFEPPVQRGRTLN
jgi:phage gp45-like